MLHTLLRVLVPISDLTMRMVSTPALAVRTGAFGGRARLEEVGTVLLRVPGRQIKMMAVETK